MDLLFTGELAILSSQCSYRVTRSQYVWLLADQYDYAVGSCAVLRGENVPATATMCIVAQSSVLLVKHKREFFLGKSREGGGNTTLVQAPSPLAHRWKGEGSLVSSQARREGGRQRGPRLAPSGRGTWIGYSRQRLRVGWAVRQPPVMPRHGLGTGVGL